MNIHKRKVESFQLSSGAVIEIDKSTTFKSIRQNFKPIQILLPKTIVNTMIGKKIAQNHSQKFKSYDNKQKSLYNEKHIDELNNLMNDIMPKNKDYITKLNKQNYKLITDNIQIEVLQFILKNKAEKNKKYLQQLYIMKQNSKNTKIKRSFMTINQEKSQKLHKTRDKTFEMINMEINESDKLSSMSE